MIGSSRARELATGQRVVISSASIGAVDASRQIAYFTENLYDAVIAVDLTSGYRQVVAR